MSLRAPAGRQRPRPRVRHLVLLLALLPSLAAAQVPADQDQPRSRIRDRYKASPQGAQKLDEALRKLKSDDPETRLEGIRGLGEVNDAKAIENLVAAASDPDMRIRIKSIDVLGNIKANDAAPFLIQQLFMRDTDNGMKQRLLAALGKIGDKRATSPIVDVLSRNVDPATRGNAVFALGDIRDPAAISALEVLAKEGQDEPLRGLAQAAIKKIRERPQPSLVLPALAVDRRGQGGPPTP
jgi:HEAT repeat protein